MIYEYVCSCFDDTIIKECPMLERNDQYCPYCNKLLTNRRFSTNICVPDSFQTTRSDVVDDDYLKANPHIRQM